MMIFNRRKIQILALVGLIGLQPMVRADYREWVDSFVSRLSDHQHAFMGVVASLAIVYGGFRVMVKRIADGLAPKMFLFDHTRPLSSSYENMNPIAINPLENVAKILDYQQDELSNNAWLTYWGKKELIARQEVPLIEAFKSQVCKEDRDYDETFAKQYGHSVASLDLHGSRVLSFEKSQGKRCAEWANYSTYFRKPLSQLLSEYKLQKYLNL
jgi:hypothetical protein